MRNRISVGPARLSIRTVAACAVWVVVAAGCSSEKYARYEADQDGRRASMSETGKSIVGGVAVVAGVAAWVFFNLWYGQYSGGCGHGH